METVAICKSCKKRKVRYNAPEYWCSFCWADWWFEGDDFPKTDKIWFLIKDLIYNIYDDVTKYMRR